jgi:hypothetical protein
MLVLLNLIYGFNTIPIKISASHFSDIDKMFLGRKYLQDISNKALLSKIYRNLKAQQWNGQFDLKKKKVKDLSRHLTTAEMQMVSGQMKRFFWEGGLAMLLRLISNTRAREILLPQPPEYLVLQCTTL